MLKLGFFPHSNKPLAPRQETYLYQSLFAFGGLLSLSLIFTYLTFSYANTAFLKGLFIDNTIWNLLIFGTLSMICYRFTYQLFPIYRINQHAMRAYGKTQNQPWQLIAIPSTQLSHLQAEDNLFKFLIKIIVKYCVYQMRGSHPAIKNYDAEAAIGILFPAISVIIGGKARQWILTRSPWIIKNAAGEYFLLAAAIADTALPLVLNEELEIIGLSAIEREQLKKQLSEQLSAQGFSKSSLSELSAQTGRRD